MLGYQVSFHRLGAAPAKLGVVGLRTSAVGIAFHCDKEAFISLHVAGQLIELLPGLVGECILVELEGHCHRRLELIVVDV